MTEQSANNTVENKPQPDVDNLPPAVNRESVAKYLLEHPSFLIDNPDLLIQLQVNLQENGVVSLTEIQASQSREKIKQLKSQLDSIVDTARKNELIYTTYAELNLDMAKASSLSELNQTVKQHLVKTLDLESSEIMLLKDSELGKGHIFSEIQHRSIFDKKLANQPYYFGRVGKVEKEALFPNSEAGSVALVLISDESSDVSKPLGLLAIASKNQFHFQPDMDVILVDFLRKNLNYHVNKLLA